MPGGVGAGAFGLNWSDYAGGKPAAEVAAEIRPPGKLAWK